MSSEAFICELVDLLAWIAGGMADFAEPPPRGVAEHLVASVVAHGSQALPFLHQKLEDECKGDQRVEHIIDALGAIRDPSSAPYLIEFHERVGSYLTRIAAMQALRQLRTEDAYIYMSTLLKRHAVGDIHAFETPAEIVVACRAMGEWADPRAIEPLQLALRFTEAELHGIKRAARESLANYPDAE